MQKTTLPRGTQRITDPVVGVTDAETGDPCAGAGFAEAAGAARKHSGRAMAVAAAVLIILLDIV